MKLPAIFGDHMVLQRDTAVPVWGTAAAGEEVTVSIAGQTVTAKAGADGKWSVKLAKLSAAGPHTLTVKGKNTVTISDVLVGEVWLGSGQSNMAMTVNRAKDFEAEQAAAKLPQIRMFIEASGASATAQSEGKGSWVVCSPDAVARFSATAYFFGREIHQALGVPVGLINSSVGGTPIESWIAPGAQTASPELKGFFESARNSKKAADPAQAKAKFDADLAKWQEAAKKAKGEGKPAPRRPQDPVALAERKGNVGGLFNGKIAPLIPYAIRGALWYQGEANSVPEKAQFYEAQLKLLVTDWRKLWGHEFPFAWVQLPNFGGPGRDWPAVREAMLKTLALPQTGMAITIDIGEEKDIHPKNKQDVGRRLAAWALGTVYGQKVATSGPLPAGHQVRGREVVLSFKHTDGGLIAKGGELKGFVIAGADKQWQPATARIEGDKVIVSCAALKQPIAVRYAWENWPTCNLYNGAGLPASPFRTDDWK
ncbi:MAG: sialate O-acetylesterase [Limisphaerales bacterium]|nr:MAG: sialate O-acetylesterase [Limisphaerales bacterium]KAG0506745.1 MAG: sialate O-acetylesterase [Limisphaerales bacterium]